MSETVIVNPKTAGDRLQARLEAASNRLQNGDQQRTAFAYLTGALKHHVNPNMRTTFTKTKIVESFEAACEFAISGK